MDLSKRCSFIAAAITAATMLSAAPSFAQTTVYTSQSAFDAATTALTDVDFVGIAPSDSFTNWGTTGSPNGVDFFSTTSPNYINPTDQGYYGYTSTDQILDVANPAFTPPLDLTISFPSSRAVGVDIASNNEPASFTYTLSNSPTVYTESAPDYNVSASAPTFGFVGFTTTSPFDSLTINYPSGAGPTGIALLDFQSGTPAAPETSSLLALAIMVCAGSLLLFFRNRSTATQN